MEKQGMEGGIFAIKCIDPNLDEWLNTIPPLGTVNEDGNPTSEVSIDTCIAGTYKESQAVMGWFEQMFGKVSFSLTIDEDPMDSNDLTTARDKAKGYQNIEGIFEFDMINEDSRWDGAVEGNWDYTALGYRRRKAFRPYEVWVMMTPDDKRATIADAAERLWKLVGVKLGRVELEAGQPNKFRIPFTARRIFKFTKWAEPTAVNVFVDAAIADDASYSLGTPISTPDLFHTRLKFSFTGVKSGTHSLVIHGYNIYGEPITEDVDLSAEDGDFTYITKNYFSYVNASGITVVGAWFDTATKMEIDEYDVGLTP